MVKSLLAPTDASAMPTSRALARTGSSAIRDLLEITERPEVISLAGGLPTPAAFPVDLIAAATAEVLAESPGSALQYGATEGFGPLRDLLADGHGTDRSGVTVTHGSQQALDLLARATTDPGQVIALADPGYVGAIQAFRAVGAELAGIPSDEQGMRVDVLADRLAAGLRPTLVYVVANFDNPTGATLSVERRQRLAELADRYGFWLVDDDPYGSLRWSGDALPPLRSWSDRVISVGTVSKTVCPGLRVGWAVAPTELSRSLVILKQAADLHTGSLSQQIVHRVLAAPGFIEAHLPAISERYRAQAEVLVGALEEQLGPRIRFGRPDGGMFLWADLPELDDPGGRGTAGLLDATLRHGMAFVPGTAFGVEEEHPTSLRLSFATTDPVDLVEAVRRLRLALG